ncbi:glycosyltransferase family 2 protein [Prolixibacteraceae bacterium JC049]|nr:glycosyltransferase family 2 protein [Prolixibacteraceae bacterium JC049]
MQYQLAISIVLFNNRQEEVDYLLKLFSEENIDNLLILLIDNSIKPCWCGTSKNVIYKWNKVNVGFGKGHNQAFEHSLQQKIPFHLVCNLDISFRQGTLRGLLDYLIQHNEVGAVSPVILNNDNTCQFNGRPLPSLKSLFYRRFVEQKDKEQYRTKKGVKPIEWMSGCFMLLRVSAVKSVGGFDTRFFLYMEDVDLSRRMATRFPLYLHQEQFIVHKRQRGSYSSLLLTFYHVVSTLKYFGKWRLENDKK